MKNFIKKILVSFGYRSLGLDHNNEHSKWAKPIGHCILIADIIDEKQIELRSIFRSVKQKNFVDGQPEHLQYMKLKMI